MTDTEVKEFLEMAECLKLSIEDTVDLIDYIKKLDEEKK